MTLRVCPALHPRADIDGGFFSSPVALPLSDSLMARLGRFDDPKRKGWSGVIPPVWGAEDYIIGHNGNDLGPNPADDTLYAMADGKIVRTQLTDVDDGGVWLAYRVRCPECGRDFLPRCLHLLGGSVLVKVGDHVVKGQPLARCDTTGSAHWKHLHLDLRHAANDTQNASTNYGPTWGIPYDPQAWKLAWPVTVPVPPTLVHLEVDRPLLRPGATGRGVSELQALLNTRGFTLPVYGLYGAATVAAVKAFQSKAGLVADGIVGVNTWTQLLDF